MPSPGGAPGQGGQADLPVPVAPGKPLVHVVVPFSTLIGMDHQPVELAGYGPIPADLAREVAVDSVWQRLVVDPMSGALLDHGRTTYRPPAALADYVAPATSRAASRSAAVGYWIATWTTRSPSTPIMDRPTRRTCTAVADIITG